MLGEYVEYQSHPIDNVTLEDLLQVALLRGRQLVVEDNHVDVERTGLGGELVCLSRADEQRSVGTSPFDQCGTDGIATGSVGEEGQLVQARLCLSCLLRVARQADEECVLPDDLEVGDGGCEPPAGAAAARVLGHEGHTRAALLTFFPWPAPRPTLP